MRWLSPALSESRQGRGDRIVEPVRLGCVGRAMVNPKQSTLAGYAMVRRAGRVLEVVKLDGYGYCVQYPMQQFFRDWRPATIGAGTSEIQRNIIARGLGL